MGFLSSQNDTKIQPVQGLASTDYGTALQQSMQNSQGANANQTAYAQMLLAQANGGGPNLANAQLQQGLNRSNQATASTIGSQKGINPALQAKLISEQQAGNNQAAVGQASTNRMEQQLQAQQQLGNVYQNQAQNALGAANAYGNLQQGQNSGLIQSQLGVQGLQEDISKQNTANSQAGIGMGAGALSAGFSAGKGLAHGGYVPAYAGGGSVDYVLSPFSGMPKGDPNSGSNIGKAAADAYKQFSKKGTSDKSLQADDEDITSGVIDDGSIGGAGEEAGGSAGAGEGAAAAGEGAAAAGEGAEVAAAADTASELAPLVALASQGGKINGRATVSGDSLRNDTVPAMLSPGEVVIPRSASDTPDHAKEFMEALEKSHKGNEKVEYKHVLAAQKNLHDRLSDIERLACGGYVGRM